MQITRLVKKQEDGTFEATLVLTNEQTQFLVNFAIGLLVQSGLATIEEREVNGEDETLASPDQIVVPTPETIN